MRKSIPYLLFVLSSPAAAQSDLDAVLEGFDDTPATTSVEEALGGFDAPPEVGSGEPFVARKPWELGGAFTASSAYAYGDAPEIGEVDYHGLTRLRAKLNLQFDAHLGHDWETRVGAHAYHDFVYSLDERSHYTDAVLDELENEAELGEAWLRGRLTPRLDLKVGRQIVVWGKSDNLRVTDVINPLDNREPGMVDIEDLRLPLTMTRLDYYTGRWNLSAMAIHEVRYNKTPPFGSDFYPFPGPLPPERVEGGGVGNPEYTFAANGIFTGWDLSLYLARVKDDQPYRDTTTGGSPVLRHAEIGMVGTALNVAEGNWLLKGELAHFSGLRFSGVDDTRSRTDVLLGVEYAGLTDATISFEIADRHLHAFDRQLREAGQDEDSVQTALRYQGDFRHNRVHVTFLNVLNGTRGDGGGFTRFTTAYDLEDALTLTGGLIVFHPGDQTPFDAIGDSDRVFGEVKYSF